MKNKKIKFLSGVSSLTIALGAVLTSIASATEPNPSMPNLSDNEKVREFCLETRRDRLVYAANVLFPPVDCIIDASEKKIFNTIKSGHTIEVLPPSFFGSLDMNKNISFESKFKLLSYYVFIRLLTMKEQPLPTDEEINWDTYNQPGYKFCLDIVSIVEKNHFYGEDGVRNFGLLCCAIESMAESKVYDHSSRDFELKAIFGMLRDACNLWL